MTTQIIKSIMLVSTTSENYVPIADCTSTPVAGRYFISFSAMGSSTLSSALASYSIFINNTEQTDSTRLAFGDTEGHTPNLTLALHTQTLATLDGQQIVSIRIKTSGGIFKVTNRNLVLLVA